MSEAAIRLLIGRNIRARRKGRSMSQGELGETVGVSYQQIQKYETGVNSIKSEGLVEFARTFGCSVNELCE